MSDCHLDLNHDIGEYQDRRDLKMVDCSKTIWILASNALDPTIKEFCKKNQKSIFLDDDPSELLRLMKVLGKELKDKFKERFEVSVPVTS
jgi:hypothetical protein